MIVTIIAVGKTKKDYVKDGIVEYEKRIAKYARIKWIFIDPSKASNIQDIVAEESAKIVRQIQPSIPLIALDKSGKSYTSEEFALELEEYTGVGQVQFVIGGSHGFDLSLIGNPSVLAFSKMTFEHDIIRLILLEQLYRGLDILGGGKYHK